MHSANEKEVDARLLPKNWRKTEGGRNAAENGTSVYQRTSTKPYEDLRRHYAQEYGIELPPQGSSTNAEIVVPEGRGRKEQRYKVEFEAQKTGNRTIIKMVSDESLRELLE